ncbi:YtxH domain-containing protein [Campylobacter lanienae]|uniref:YtxH domain-containing protein n=1 Tax=Campylobacter lanienae TaxID=75658 RepID=UPI00242F30FD|nr:YtxH domain-containing protein [Campylobacter lanienae]MDD7513842.1 YtxH domain-containing protein [Campylobacter lanienae]MDY5520030.1 YtxH domain-containing protein [Campylobacter lanienae]MDY6134382.1 YtxH domain-containing protein [Campylobacter lanienae]
MINNNPYIQNLNSNPTSQNSQPTPNTQPKQSSQNGFLDGIFSGSNGSDFLKGALIGAAATYILTNENAQRAIFKGFAKLSTLFECGLEELKERYEDAKAEANE